MKMLRSLGLAALIATASACGGGNSRGTADLLDHDDLTPPLPPVDLATADGPAHDLATPDAALPDAATPDIALPIDLGPPAANAMCANATTIMNGTALTGENSAGGRDDISADCRHGAHGTVLYYTVTVPGFAKLSVTATPTGAAPPDLVVRVLDGCAATSCLTFADDGLAGAAETANYTNPSASDATVIVAVGSYDAPLPGTFNLSATVTALPPPPTNITCAMPMTVTDGTMLTGQDASLGVETQDTACLGATGTVLYYVVVIPTNNALKVVATPESSWDITIRALDACGATSCLASADSGVDGDAETLNYKNTSGGDQKIILAVGSYDPSVTGTFALSVSITPLPPPPTNLTCATAITVTDGSMLTNQDLTAATQTLTAACLSGDSGNVLFYSASVPPGNVLTVTETPDDGTLDGVLRFMNACGANSCLASVDNTGSGSAETLSYKNTGGAAQTVIIGVGAFDSFTTGPFDLAVSIAPPPPPPANATCATPTPVANGSSLTLQNAALGTDVLDAACQPSAHGTVLYYSLTIAAGKTLTAVATPTGVPSWDPVVRLIDGCAPASCRASVDNGASGTAETLTYKNTGASPINVLLAVGSFNATSSGTFSLTISIP